MMGGSSRFDTQPHVQRKDSSLQVDSRHAATAPPHLDNYSLARQPDARAGSDLSIDSVLTGVTANIPRNPPSDAPRANPSTNVASPSLHPSGRLRDQHIRDPFQLQPGHKQMSAGEPIERQQAEPNAVDRDTHRNGPYPRPRSASPSKRTAGQKRTAGGLVKPASNANYSHSRVDATRRRRSRSIGSLSHGSRIAALSVHLRTRLSYAAAQVEKSRKTQSAQAQLPLDFLKKEPSSPTPLIDCLDQARNPSSDPRMVELGSPVSAPDPSHLSSLHSGARASPIARSENFSPFSLNGTHLKPQERQHTSQPPRLAPPADIVPSVAGAGRRRPNPNEHNITSSFAPVPRHRRHHSQHELGGYQPSSRTETILVPGTPPFSASIHSNTTYNSATQPSSQPQNTAMEQDAIETLLFMSSPGNSGYRSNSQNSINKQTQIRRNIAAAMDPAPGAPWSQASQSEGKSSQISGPVGPVSGLEAQAGDEIDRMLDQMDSDSEDERSVVAQYASRVKLGSAPADSSRARNALFGS